MLIADPSLHSKRWTVDSGHSPLAFEEEEEMHTLHCDHFASHQSRPPHTVDSNNNNRRTSRIEYFASNWLLSSANVVSLYA